MTRPDWDAEARKAVAAGYGWDSDYFAAHVLEAPKHCGDGYDGSCVAGECEIVGVVKEVAALARRAYRAGLERAVEAVQSAGGDNTDYHVAAIRREIERLMS